MFMTAATAFCRVAFASLAIVRFVGDGAGALRVSLVSDDVVELFRRTDFRVPWDGCKACVALASEWVGRCACAGDDAQKVLASGAHSPVIEVVGGLGAVDTVPRVSVPAGVPLHLTDLFIV